MNAKHACFHVFSPFSAYFSPHNIIVEKGLLEAKSTESKVCWKMSSKPAVSVHDDGYMLGNLACLQNPTAEGANPAAVSPRFCLLTAHPLNRYTSIQKGVPSYPVGLQ